MDLAPIIRGSRLPVFKRPLVLLCVLLACAALGAQDGDADLGRRFSVELSEQAGVLVSSQGGLGFAQYLNDVGLGAEFRVLPGLWLGFGAGYLAALPSTISLSSPLAVPGFDALRIDPLHLGVRLPEGLGLRLAAPQAVLVHFSAIDSWLFFLSAELSVSWLFDLGPLCLEPGLAGNWQFRQDLYSSWSASAFCRISLPARSAP